MKAKLFLVTILIFWIFALSIIQIPGCIQSGKAEMAEAGDSLKVKSAEVTAKKFLTFMNEDKPAEVKKLCSPSATEFVNKLVKSDVFNGQNKWKDSIKILDVVLKTGNEVDTAIVNYKVGDYHNIIKLVADGKEWKVTYSNELLGCKIREIESWDLISADNYTNYIGMRLRVKNLLYYAPSESLGDTLHGYVFAACDTVAKKISMQKKYDLGYYNQQSTFYFNKMELESWTENRDNLFFVFETSASFNHTKAAIKQEGEKLSEHFYYTFNDKPFIAEGTLHNRECKGSYMSRHICNLFFSEAELISGSAK
jgi:sarcosine oxidase delta subunit